MELSHTGYLGGMPSEILTCGCLGGRRERELVWPVDIFLMQMTLEAFSVPSFERMNSTL